MKTKSQIKEAVDNFQTFLESDMWYASNNEWKTEDKMIEYIKAHFKILKEDLGIEE